MMFACVSWGKLFQVRKFFLITALVAFASPLVLAQKMDNKGLDKILRSVTDSLDGGPGMWQFEYSDRLMFVITDEKHDRMRIISPVRTLGEIAPDELGEAMIANFHSVLDVRYAVSEDILWAAYIHPLQSLSEEQVRDALLQVFRAAETFGTTYSSTELVFPGGRPGQTSEGNGKKKM